MSYKVVVHYPDGSVNEEPEICETEDEADELGWHCLNCYIQGAEDLYLSNPGDYPLVEGEGYFDIIEVYDSDD